MDTLSKLNNVSVTKIQNYVGNVKGRISKGNKLYLSFLIPLVIVLIYLYYRNTLNKRLTDKKEELKYNEIVDLKKLPKCNQIPKELQYKLVDYYIASSYNSVCIGNQHYDYVSKDMLIELLNAGARLVEIPICQKEVYYSSAPIVGTAYRGETLVTSLNLLELEDVCNVILANAFKKDNTKINYPLFIKLNLHTSNNYTLDKCADIITNVFNKLLLNNEKYKWFPLGLEKLCNLLNKVIIICSDNYTGSKLRNIVVPLNKLYEEYHYSELGKYNAIKGDYYESDYNKLLSSKQQKKSLEVFERIFPSIDTIVKMNQDGITSSDEEREGDEGEGDEGQGDEGVEGDEDIAKAKNNDIIKNKILDNSEILNKLSSYNKIGLCLVKPHNDEDITSKNFDFMESLKYGCQFICMNYQVYDNHMKKYIEIFKKSSFRLKPSGLRYTELQIITPDIEQEFEKVSNNMVINNIKNNFKSNYLNKIVYIETFTTPGLLVKVNSNESLIFDKLKKYSDLNKYGFLILQSDYGDDNNGIILESAKYRNKVVTLIDNNMFELQKRGTSIDKLKKQTFYPVIAQNKNSSSVSFKLADLQLNTYLAFSNNKLLGIVDNSSNEVLNNLTFNLKQVKYESIITLYSLTNKNIYGFPSGLVGLKGKPNKENKYIIIPVSGTSIFNNEVYLKKKDDNKYLLLNNANLLEKNMEKYELEDRNKFIIKKEKGFLSVFSKTKTQLIYKDDRIQFTIKSNTKSSDSLLKYKLTYEIR